MKKKIFNILLVFILLFLVSIEPVFAASGTHYRAYVISSIQTLKNKGLITYNWYSQSGSTKLYANSPAASSKSNANKWVLHSVEVNGKYYISYCLNMGYNAKNNAEMKQYNNLDSIKFNVSNLSSSEKARRKNMLKTLLLYGYNPVPANNKTLSSLIANDPSAQIKLIAMQVLVWEVVEGGRTSFDTVEPQWNGTNSFYNKVIYKNGGSDPTKTNTLYYWYNTFREAARVADQQNPSPAFNESIYTMTWDSTNKKYQVVVSGLGDYDKCTVNNSNINLSVSGSNVTLSSTEKVGEATVTCKYYRGTGASDQSSSESFKYFNFKNNTAASQDLVYGSGWKIYSKSFSITTENSNIAIKKIDTESKAISGAKFTLTHMTNQSYSVVLDGNGIAKDLVMSGKYRISETTTPKGYEKINDFNITINAKTHKITSCDQEKKDSKGNIKSCLNDQVRVAYNNDTIELTIVDVAKNFKILKVDKNGNPINGATFEIRDSKGNLVKFSLENGNIFKYNTEGTITSLNIASLSSYPISLLPEGEYRIIETSVPSPYRLSNKEEDRTTLIKINSNSDLLVYDKTKNTYISSSSGIVRVVNYTTRINIEKTGHGSPLEGVQFELYNSDKTEKIKSSLISSGKYLYVDNQESVDNYVYVTNSNGLITIDNLPAGTYYFKEIYTIPPYVLPVGDGVYTKVTIGIDEKGVSINGNYVLDTIEISNSPNSFNFYKKDTEGNPLTTGKYKLQKYDKKAKKYVDLKLVEVENDGTYSNNTDIYKVDEKNGKIQFTLKKGVATFIDMDSSSTYRIIETVAPEGYTKVATKDTATVHIDEYGNASGLLVLIDQKVVKEDDSASAELIINIQTGKERIMYGAVIFIVIGVIAGLIIYNKRK